MFGLMLMYFSSINSVFLLQMAKKFKDNLKVQRWTNIARDVNFFLTFVFLAFLVPLRADFEWFFTQPLLYAIQLIVLMAMQPDSKLDLVMHAVILIFMYLQLASAFILTIFIVNLKVFYFGYKRTKYVRTND
jgi:hypothetical protein